jgi:hypothetical protein
MRALRLMFLVHPLQDVLASTWYTLVGRLKQRRRLPSAFFGHILSALHVSVSQSIDLLFISFHSLLVLAPILPVYGLRHPATILLGPNTTYKIIRSGGKVCHNTPTAY